MTNLNSIQLYVSIKTVRANIIFIDIINIIDIISLFVVCFCLFSYSTVWLQICYVAEDSHKLPTLLPLPLSVGIIDVHQHI